MYYCDQSTSTKKSESEQYCVCTVCSVQRRELRALEPLSVALKAPPSMMMIFESRQIEEEEEDEKWGTGKGKGWGDLRDT